MQQNLPDSISIRLDKLFHSQKKAFIGKLWRFKLNFVFSASIVFYVLIHTKTRKSTMKLELENNQHSVPFYNSCLLPVPSFHICSLSFSVFFMLYCTHKYVYFHTLQSRLCLKNMCFSLNKLFFKIYFASKINSFLSFKIVQTLKKIQTSTFPETHQLFPHKCVHSFLPPSPAEEVIILNNNGNSNFYFELLLDP